MVRPRLLSLVLGVACLLAAALPTSALANPPLGADGLTAPNYDYSAAVRERVYIPVAGVDQDGDGADDIVAAEIMRPAGTGPSFQVPAIIDPSPYYTTICRGIETQCIGDTNGDGVNDKWPLFLDNYFVPRGYAVVLAEAVGTANSTGCVLHGGPGDVAGMKAVIDWLQGRVLGFRDLGHTVPMTADWDNGKAAMIGKSYDGTLTEGVAATGVSGLTTIVPESAIDDWYSYSRMGGIRFNTHYPATLSQAVTDSADLAGCAASRTAMSAADGDATGDRNAFWDARDYRPGLASNLTASVLAVHGLQDDNVRMDHFASFWAIAKARGVPRKLWLMRAGHADPFDVRRDQWVDTLHRWFDYWLYGIDDHIMDAPRVDLQNTDTSWTTASDWPAPGTAPVDLHLRATAANQAGDLGLSAGDGVDSVSWTDPTSLSESQMMATPTGAQTNRRVFLSAPLRHDLRISGTAIVELKAALSTTQSNMGALLVDYGAGTEVTLTLEGVKTDTTLPKTCWGPEDTTNGDWSSCYSQVDQPTVSVTQWRVTKGILDSSNRTSLTTPSPLTTGLETDFPISLIPQDYVFPAGHQIGVILVGNYTGFTSVRGTSGAAFTMNAKASTITLPVVGGASAAIASGGFDAVTPTLTVPGDRAVEATSAAGATVSWPAPAVSDDEDPSPSVACAPASGSTFPVGATTVTCTATDASGNQTVGTFTVTVSAQPVPPGSGSGSGETIGGTTSTSPTPTGTTSPVPSGVKPSGTLDTVPVTLTGLQLSGRPGQVLARFRLSGPATVKVAVKRHGAKRATKTISAKLGAGRRTLRLKAKALRPGRYDVTITVRSPSGAVKTLHRTVTVRAG